MGGCNLQKLCVVVKNLEAILQILQELISMSASMAATVSWSLINHFGRRVLTHVKSETYVTTCLTCMRTHSSQIKSDKLYNGLVVQNQKMVQLRETSFAYSRLAFQGHCHLANQVFMGVYSCISQWQRKQRLKLFVVFVHPFLDDGFCVVLWYHRKCKYHRKNKK